MLLVPACGIKLLSVLLIVEDGQPAMGWSHLTMTFPSKRARPQHATRSLRQLAAAPARRGWCFFSRSTAAPISAFSLMERSEPAKRARSCCAGKATGEHAAAMSVSRGNRPKFQPPARHCRVIFSFPPSSGAVPFCKLRGFAVPGFPPASESSQVQANGWWHAFRLATPAHP